MTNRTLKMIIKKTSRENLSDVNNRKDFKTKLTGEIDATNVFRMDRQTGRRRQTDRQMKVYCVNIVHVDIIASRHSPDLKGRGLRKLTS